ncbi:MAG: DUF11 domain-containing protein [Anaerolineae bacterium]|nr:DUF11 domain-containing protein [Anaerolineae bacterium]
MLVLILSLTLMLMVSVSGVAQAAGSVSGHVFRDYNANGVQDTDEPNVAGVTINANGAAGTIVGTTISTATVFPADPLTTINYTVNWLGPDTRVRLEFSGLPGIAQQGAFALGTSAGSGTSIQFVDAGATPVNYGINRPSDYCLATNNLKLVTTCFQLGPQTAGAPVVVSFDNSGTPNSEATVARDNQVGTVWGVAYKRAVGTTPGTIFVSAFAKRQAEYGSGGNGAIYAIQGATATVFATIPLAGLTPHNPANYPVDSTFYAAPGEEGLGDMDISEDGTTLYVINLADRNLYSVNTTSGAVSAPLGIIGNPACVNGIYRPFGLGVRDGIVYVGGVCTAELGGTRADLHAYVYSYNPVTAVTSALPVLNFPLNYPRGCADLDPPVPVYGAPTPPLICRTGKNGSNADWQPWSDVWPHPDQTPPGSGFDSNPGGDQFFAYPQPMVTGIEFVGEDMVVSMRDRMGDQIGYRDNGPDDFVAPPPTIPFPNPFPNQLVEVSAGDILRASPNVGNTWTIENNAQGTDFGASGGNGNEQGPGNGEFYYQESLNNFHDETITGGIVQVPGAAEISANVMDPQNTFSAGSAWFDNGTGARRTTNGSIEIIPSTAPFGKGNGLGDLAALCDSAPVEIGNFVWFDANKNGIQDPNEVPLSGVEVQLFDPGTANVIATATTDANGQYIFSSNPNAAVTGNAAFLYNLPIVQSRAYQVRIDTAQSALLTYTVTTPTVGAGANATRDSNGVLNTVTKFDIANVTIGTAGQNNHTLDFGFYVGAPLTPTPPGGTPGSPQTPVAPVTLDPVITKQVNPAFAQPGDEVRWTISITNPYATAIPNVSFVDNFPGQLEIISTSVDTAGGLLVVNGNTVSYSIPVLNPGQTIKVTVVTRIRLGTPVPFIITNTVNLSGATVGSASATVLSVGSLPATGFEPLWRTPLLIGMVVLLLLFGVGVIRLRQRGYSTT